MHLSKRAAAEFFGTFWLVFGGCGSAVLAAAFPALGIGFVGVSLAFGLTVLTMAFAIGHISGCHLNPAVTLGLVAGKRFPAKEIAPYWIAQVLGALAASGVLYVIFSGRDTWTLGGFASNGYGLHSPGGFPLGAVMLAEVFFTAVFVFIIASTSRKSMPVGQTGLTVGLTLTVIHLISIPIDNTSVNPARSLATAIFQGGWALNQLWVFIIFPLVGGILGAAIWKTLRPESDEETEEESEAVAPAPYGKRELAEGE